MWREYVSLLTLHNDGHIGGTSAIRCGGNRGLLIIHCWNNKVMVGNDGWLSCWLYGVWSIDGNYRVITLIFKKYGNLPLCLENCALFSLPPMFTNILYTYIWRYIIYPGEPSGNIPSNCHGTFIHIFMHGYYPIYQKKISKLSFFMIYARKYVSKDHTFFIHLQNFLTLIPFMIQ